MLLPLTGRIVVFVRRRHLGFQSHLARELNLETLDPSLGSFDHRSSLVLLHDVKIFSLSRSPISGEHFVRLDIDVRLSH